MHRSLSSVYSPRSKMKIQVEPCKFHHPLLFDWNLNKAIYAGYTIRFYILRLGS